MSDEAPEVLKPLKTFSHLAKERRRPSEYEITTTKAYWLMDSLAPGDDFPGERQTKEPFEISSEIPMAKWYHKYRDESPLQYKNWEAYRDPDETIYRTYCRMQDGQETYVDGILDEFSETEHDVDLDPKWVKVLASLYTPGRYPLCALQMGSAYIAQMAGSSTIANSAMFQTADEFRWVSRVAYRTAELAKTHKDAGFGQDERKHWEGDAPWQGFRELFEKALVAYDMGESFTAINLVAKPAFDEAFFRQFGASARRNNDMLVHFLADAALRDSERSRRWSTSFVELALNNPANQKVFQGWIDKWVPLADKAIDAFCGALPDLPDGAKDAKKAAKAFRASLGFSG
ncbi:MAG: toluene monooxygenase [Alphaproteobacteria bacterium]|nr:toluene monooxygenase [Alphaproteobacteria bacterium]